CGTGLEFHRPTAPERSQTSTISAERGRRGTCCCIGWAIACSLLCHKTNSRRQVPRAPSPCSKLPPSAQPPARCCGESRPHGQRLASAALPPLTWPELH